MCRYIYIYKKGGALLACSIYSHEVFTDGPLSDTDSQWVHLANSASGSAWGYSNKASFDNTVSEYYSMQNITHIIDTQITYNRAAAVQRSVCNMIHVQSCSFVIICHLFNSFLVGYNYNVR